MSGGRLNVKLYGAGEIVPAFEVFDAVAQGTADLGHTASFFWSGKFTAAASLTAWAPKRDSRSRHTVRESRRRLEGRRFVFAGCRTQAAGLRLLTAPASARGTTS